MSKSEIAKLLTIFGFLTVVVLFQNCAGSGGGGNLNVDTLSSSSTLGFSLSPMSFAANPVVPGPSGMVVPSVTVSGNTTNVICSFSIINSAQEPVGPTAVTSPNSSGACTLTMTAPTTVGNYQVVATVSSVGGATTSVEGVFAVATSVAPTPTPIPTPVPTPGPTPVATPKPTPIPTPVQTAKWYYFFETAPAGSLKTDLGVGGGIATYLTSSGTACSTVGDYYTTSITFRATLTYYLVCMDSTGAGYCPASVASGGETCNLTTAPSGSYLEGKCTVSGQTCEAGCSSGVWTVNTPCP